MVQQDPHLAKTIRCLQILQLLHHLLIHSCLFIHFYFSLVRLSVFSGQFSFLDILFQPMRGARQCSFDLVVKKITFSIVKFLISHIINRLISHLLPYLFQHMRQFLKRMPTFMSCDTIECNFGCFITFLFLALAFQRKLTLG